MELIKSKPMVYESVRNFKQSNYLNIGELLVVPENEFDHQIVNRMAKKLKGGGGNPHILMREIVSNGLVYDSKKQAKLAVKDLNIESEKLRAAKSKKKSKK